MRNPRAPLNAADIDTLDWAKGDGLIPAIVQDASTMQVLMMAYMNRESLAATLAPPPEGGFATFFSRSRNALWRKGDTSGNRLRVVSVLGDCDDDTLLVYAHPEGPACHEGTTSCFGADDAPGIGFLPRLAQVVAARRGADPDSSYTARLFARGMRKIAQKVGEEGVEAALAGAAQDRSELTQESADLLFHLLVLLEANEIPLDDVIAVLRERHAARG